MMNDTQKQLKFENADKPQAGANVKRLGVFIFLAVFCVIWGMGYFLFGANGSAFGSFIFALIVVGVIAALIFGKGDTPSDDTGGGDDDSFDDYLSPRGGDIFGGSDIITDPAYSSLPGNIYHDSLSNDTDIITDPAYSFMPGNIYHDSFDTSCGDLFSSDTFDTFSNDTFDSFSSSSFSSDF